MGKNKFIVIACTILFLTCLVGGSAYAYLLYYQSHPTSSYESSDYGGKYGVKELNNDGLKGFLKDAGVTKSDNELRDSMSKADISEKIQDYVLGNSELTLADMKPYQLAELKNAMSVLYPDQGAVSAYREYIRKKYYTVRSED